MRKHIATILGCAAVALAREAAATEYVVSPSGSDAASGLAGAPFQTIQHAVDVAAPGDTVTVEDGSYAGFFISRRGGTAAQRMVVRARNPLHAVITGPSKTASDPQDSVQLTSASFVTIDGFEVTGAPRAGVSIRTLEDVTGADTRGDIVQRCHVHHNGGGVTAGRHDGIFTGFALDLLVQDNEVDHNGEHGIYVSNAADNPIVQRNHVHDNLANGIQINADVSTGGDGLISNWKILANVVDHNGGGAAINLDGAIFGVLANNLVYANANAGITLFRGDAAEASHDNLIVSNTVYDPTGARSALQIADGADRNVVFDNVLYSAAAGLEVQSVTGLVHDNNLVSSYDGASAAAHEASPAANQVFANAAAWDLRPGAAAVDRGVSQLSGQSVPNADLLGAARPQGGAADIGCYELAAPPPSAPDAGAPADAGTPHDAGAPADAGTAHDAGSPADAGIPHDAGAPSALPPPPVDPGAAPASAPQAAPPADPPSAAAASCSVGNLADAVNDPSIPHPATAFLIVAAVAAVWRMARRRIKE